MTSVKIEEIKLEDTFFVCRICLQPGEEDEEMVSIFERDSVDSSLCLYEKIEKCGGIKILTDPELPTRICRKCYACLTLVHKFRVICKNSDNYLREFVCKSTRAQDEEDGMAEYLMEYNPEEKTTTMAQVLQQAGHTIDETQTSIDYEVVDGYTELWLEDGEDAIVETQEHQNDGDEADDDFEEDCMIEEDHGDSSQPSPAQSPSPSKKTLGISSDGAAVIHIKKEQMLTKEKQIHICDVCGNVYPRKYALEAHMRRHRNERPFECEICHMSFHLNFQLTRHIRKHTGARPYSCQYCKRNFADRSTMVKHERIHRNERPYTCDTCGKSFTYSSVLKVHQLTHTGEKPFNCGICGKRFARAHHLRAHLETLLHQHDPRSKQLLKQIKRDDDDQEEFINV